MILSFDNTEGVAFRADAGSRTISGRVVPYGDVATSDGRQWAFARGSIRTGENLSRVKFLREHDVSKPIGVAAGFDDREDGLYGTFRVARGAAGDEALSLASEGVLDAFSIGLGGDTVWEAREGVNHVTFASVREVSLVAIPAFSEARIEKVALSAANERIDTVTDVTPAADVKAAPADAPKVEFSSAAIADLGRAIAAGFAEAMPAAPVKIDATANVRVTREELPYRFTADAGRAEFSLLDDLKAAASGNSASEARLTKFAGEAFAVTSANVASMNPTQNRPELYVPNLQYSYPLWEMVTTGTLADKTPFTIPKFASATGLVANHVEGVEPTPGAFTTTAQTVTPAAQSGKVEVVREVWDQGGNPQTDGIIWAEMVNAYNEAREARIAAALKASPTVEVNLASAVNTALLDSLTGVIIDKVNSRGGQRFTGFAADGLLFKALVNAQDTGGRKLLPLVNPQNAQGGASASFDTVQIGSLGIRSAWALNTGVPNSWVSFLFVPSSVYAWASAPQRFTFEYRVSAVDIAIWGYSASAILRDSDVQPIDYTTADV